MDKADYEHYKAIINSNPSISVPAMVVAELLEYKEEHEDG